MSHATLPQRLRKAFAGYWPALASISVASGLGALMEALTLMLVFALLGTLSSGSGQYSSKFGVLQTPLTFSLRELFAVCFAAIVVRLAAAVWAGWTSSAVQARHEHDQRETMFRHFLGASWQVQSQEKAGQLHNFVTSNVAINNRSLHAVAQSMVSLSSFLVLVVAAFIAESLYVAILVGAAVALFAAVRPLSNMARRHATVKAKLNMAYAQQVNQSVALAREIQVFGARDSVLDQLGRLLGEFRKARRSANFLSALVPAIYQNLALLLVVGGMGVVYLADPTRVGSLGVVIVLLVRALTYTQGLQVSFHHISEGLPYLDQFEEVERKYIAARVPDTGETLQRIDQLGFDGVSFAYEANELILKDVSFAVKRGEIIGIIGPSGAGKSTLVQLLLRLRSPRLGRLTVNDLAAETYSMSSWFGRVSYVPQETQLLDDTVAANIAFYRSEIDQPRIEEAARLARIHDEVSSWPRGYESLVGDRGGEVSGGQRQRMCIARALAGKPDVIIFDEPTSALDVHSESKIQETLRSLSGKVTLFIVAHRLSTLNICDKIMVFEKGRLAAFGPPSELASQNAYYSDALRLSKLS